MNFLNATQFGKKWIFPTGTLVFLFFMIASVCVSKQNLWSDSNDGHLKHFEYKLVQRYKEDWSFLHNRYQMRDSEFFDPIKYVPLNRCGSIWASFGGHARARIESWHHFGFRPSKSCDTFLLTRFYYHGDLHVGDHFRLFVEGKYADSTDRNLPGGKRPLDVDTLDLQNAFLDIQCFKSPCLDFVFRIGRQELLFGKQRLVSPLNWANTRRTFRGISGLFTGNKWVVTAFLTKPVRVKKYNFNDSQGQGEFFGIYGTVHHSLSTNVDLYWLDRTRTTATFNTKTGREKRHTIGARIWGDCSDYISYDVEGAYQFGDLGSFDINAWMLAIDGAYQLPNHCFKPIIGLGFDYASGDNIENTKQSKTFSHLFPLGHAYLGYIDVIGRQNIIDTHPYLTFYPYGDLKTTIHYHHFLRASRKDALYNAGGGVVFPATAGSSGKVGSEIDLTFYYPVNEHLKTELGYCHFFKGLFVEQALSKSKSIDFIYFSLIFIF